MIVGCSLLVIGKINIMKVTGSTGIYELDEVEIKIVVSKIK